ncbi:MAG TPA: SPW repeat protein [Pseudonocardiaceae bacterium]|jgi:hypothetical protein|nr:SPW repeat protein [Pseudonocardiaceae bacterium]
MSPDRQQQLMLGGSEPHRGRLLLTPPQEPAKANLIVGIALAVLALGFASAYGRTHGITWVATVLGVWTVIAPWVVNGGVATTATIVSNVVVGLIAALLGLGAMSLGMSRTR